MKNLKAIIDGFDPKSQSVVRELMDLEFSAYKEIEWRKILVYQEYETIATKMLYKAQTWYFGSAALAIIAAGVKSRPIKLAIVETEGNTPIAGKTIGHREMDKLVIIPINSEELAEIMK